MQQYDSFNIKLTYFKVCLAYIALVPILPDYFSILGIDSRNFNALLLILLAIIYKRKIILNKRASIYFIGAVIFWSLEQIFIYTYSGWYVEGIYIFCRCVVAPMLIAIEIKNANRFNKREFM